VEQLEQTGGKLPFGKSQGARGAEASSSASPVEATFNTIKSMLSEDLVKSINGIYAFNLKGKTKAGPFH
jgi:hypothetical protein